MNLPAKKDEFTQNLIILEKALSACVSNSERWEVRDKAYRLAMAAQVFNRKDLALQFSSLVCRAEWTIAHESPPQTGGRGHKVVIPNNDFSKETLRQLRHIYSRLDRSGFDLKLKKILDKGGFPTREAFRQNAHIYSGPSSQEYYTPPDVMQAIRQIMGGIDLDPASNAIANKVVQAKKFYTKEEDGLTQDWGKGQTIWLNPPFNQLKPFMEKLLKTPFKKACFLGRMDFATHWAQIGMIKMFAANSCLFIPDDRFSFYTSEGPSGGKNPENNIIFCFNCDKQRVARAFLDYRVKGWVFNLDNCPYRAALPNQNFYEDELIF